MKNRIFVCGDTHIPHDIQKISTKNFPEQKLLSKNDVLIQLGDFGGIWYPLGMNKEQTYWLEWLARKNFTTAVVLGNHENYNEIETLPWCEMWGNEVQFWESTSGNRIYFFKRGAIYNINGKKILTIGGAKSIDKVQRTVGRSWWAKEDITYSEIENCLSELETKGYDFDFVLTHTCPNRLVMNFIHTNFWNQGKLNDPTAKFLDEIDNLVTFKGWFFGHMHIDYVHVDKIPDIIPGSKSMDGGGDDDFSNEIYTCCYNGKPLELTNWSPEEPTLYH